MFLLFEIGHLGTFQEPSQKKRKKNPIKKAIDSK